MAISDYLRDLRALVGTRLILTPTVGAIIHDDEGRVLLQRTPGESRWSMVGGAIDPGESPATALRREAWEETGLHVEIVRLVAVLGGEGFRITYPNGDRLDITSSIFHCRAVGGTLGGRDDETEELRWFPHDELPELTLPFPPEIFDPSFVGPLFL